MWVSSSNLEKERRDTMKKRTFIIKVLRLIAIILLLLTLLVIAIKIWHSFISDWVSTPIKLEGDIHLQNRMFLFFILCKFPCLHPNNTKKINLWQVLILLLIFFHRVRLFYKPSYYIISTGTFSVSVVLQSWKRKGVDEDEN